MKTDNELIAEFMGGEVDGDMVYFQNIPSQLTLNYNWTISQLQYHISWDWLMPVVEKISQMDEVASIEFFVGVTIRIWTNDQMIESMGEGIEPVYKAVVEFIKWYNKTQTP